MERSGATTAMIEARGVTKVFNDFWGRPRVRALDSVDLTVEPGTTFGLLGPNGAGKSTLIKLLLGHLYPTEGVLRVLGDSPRSTEIKKRMGYLPERTSFYRTLTARETLLFFGRLLGLSDSETSARAAQLLSMVGLEQAADRRVGEYSHGMRKRLGLAQSLLNDPDLLLLDEPTAGLDPIGCREVKDLILTLGKRGKTILMTSHLLGDVQDVCGTVMILYGGRVQAAGPVDTLLAERDHVQIRSKVVSEEKLAQVRAILEPANDADTLRITSPTRTLEEYFLSVVAEAGRSERDISGAEMGTGVADYLQVGLDETALAELTREDAAETPVAAATVDEDVLDSMRKGTESPADEGAAELDNETLAELTRKTGS